MTNPLLTYRTKNGLSQLELAEKLGISRQLVSLIESGKRRITPDNAVDWAPRLGLGRNSLLPASFARVTAAKQPEAA